ncbi:MAG: SpoIIE family protein phosphatase [Candidatus Lindowbacteria bacterium]|nr:SpoIIE family protein phosphatase [Candidatus Lindowbacteria bacterium]
MIDELVFKNHSDDKQLSPEDVSLELMALQEENLALMEDLSLASHRITCLTSLLIDVYSLRETLVQYLHIVMQESIADRGAIFHPTETEKNGLILTSNLEEEALSELTLVNGASAIQQVVETGKRIVWSRAAVTETAHGLELIDANDKMAALRMRPPEDASIESVMLIAVPTQAEKFTVLILINRRDGGSFSDADADEFDSLNSFVATAINNAMLRETRLQHENVQKELDIAQDLQRSLMPKHIWDDRTVDIAYNFIASNNVSGDFMDVVPVGASGDVIVTLGDISGHGISAAFASSSILAYLRALLRCGITDLLELSIILNRVACEQFMGKRMFTLFVGHFSPTKGILKYVSAGHDSLIHLSGKDNRLTYLNSTAPLMGVFDDLDFQLKAVSLAANDTVLFFTDGFRESFDPLPSRPENMGATLREIIMQAESDKAGRLSSRKIIDLMFEKALAVGQKYNKDDDDMAGILVRIKGTVG